MKFVRYDDVMSSFAYMENIEITRKDSSFTCIV